MQKKGFRIFDGAEQSHWMLEKANATHIYRTLVCKQITNQRTCSRDGNIFFHLMFVHCKYIV
jgi:hypothetical protein